MNLPGMVSKIYLLTIPKCNFSQPMMKDQVLGLMLMGNGGKHNQPHLPFNKLKGISILNNLVKLIANLFIVLVLQ